MLTFVMGYQYPKKYLNAMSILEMEVSIPEYGSGQFMELKMKLVDAQGLLQAIFDEGCRPSLRWVRTQQARRTIPFIKAGRKVFFDPPAVLEALAKKQTVRAMANSRRC